jgi:hypothetical protein
VPIRGNPEDGGELLKALRGIPSKPVSSKEAVMDDRQDKEARTPQTPRYVNDLQLHRVLDESLWQMERRRVDPEGSTDETT